ncbi:MAG: 50S ribosomal protein L2 [Candidatus Ryanbacteria bacterium CG10_big_fil_rev_8_21_14_0_10_43_42]|uniref:Large ribosomal subunit protein uL2 n=1 Tax=Candidatus Ryanbacteria bacterium CG10_big_fil_rev_8_21_14_0_10_43_42 TaxID=1974864 RepID=A0A2M8KY03_9BACT|nr:MAG: 50S ribosomal protein L2 [Candidatus Ryanbacteria bacterium CG10_big_fil_rev_8_21_14_0_10_43_42]
MKKYKPTSPGRRGMTVMERTFLTKKDPEKNLTFGFRRAVGRNNAGRITTRHKGGGHKRLYRLIDFYQDKYDIPARIVSNEYDPNRTTFIALVCYADGEKRYILLPQQTEVGDQIIASETAEIKPGNRTMLKSVPVGTSVYNIEVKPGTGGKMVRAAGVGAEVIAQDGGYTSLKMPSKEIRKVLNTCWASIGKLSGEEHRFVTLGKAGRSRWLGIRPTVRGSAMNPVDHPFGGGEGKTQRGMKRPKNKWGKGIRGVKTRNKKKYSNALILQRRKK